jgi:hypothetical protein
MAFPTTSVLTTFTGADENPLSEGGNWALFGAGAESAPCARLSNQAKNGSDVTNNLPARSYWTPSQFGPDVEAYATIATLPNSGKGTSVFGRIHNPTNDATYEGYLAVYTTGTGFRLFKCLSGGTFTQIGSTDATAASAGDKIGLECISTTIRCLHFTGGSWVQRVSVTDSSITGAGYIAIEFASNDLGSGRLDDFGGGTVVGSAVPHSMMLLGVG